jgi:hypothetical protein
MGEFLRWDVVCIMRRTSGVTRRDDKCEMAVSVCLLELKMAVSCVGLEFLCVVNL